MGLNTKSTNRYKNAADNIFSSMVSSTSLAYLYEPNIIDPITQAWTEGACQTVESVIPKFHFNKFNPSNPTQIDQVVTLGDVVAYVKFDDVVGVIQPSWEFKLPVADDLNIIMATLTPADCFESGTIAAGDSTLA